MATTLGSRLRSLLGARGLSITGAATAASVDRSKLSRAVHDKPRLAPEEIQRLCFALGVTHDELLDNVKLPTPPRRRANAYEQLASRILQLELDLALARSRVVPETRLYQARIVELERELRFATSNVTKFVDLELRLARAEAAVETLAADNLRLRQRVAAAEGHAIASVASVACDLLAGKESK